MRGWISPKLTGNARQLWERDERLPDGVTPQMLNFRAGNKSLVEPLLSPVASGSNRLAVALAQAPRSDSALDKPETRIDLEPADRECART